MARIEMSCNRCGAKVVTRNVDEMLNWNKTHDETCIALHPEEENE